MKPKFKELLLASFTFEESSPELTKILILNAFLFITAIVAVFSMTYNLLTTLNYTLISIDIFIFLSMILALYLLREKKNYLIAASIGTIVLFIAYVLLVFILKNQSYTLVWTYFFAPFTMIILGAKRGLVITLFFLLIILTGAYDGIGEWQNGIWGFGSFARFVLAHFVMLYVIYAMTNSYEKAYERIDTLRQREQTQLKLFEKLSITDPLTSLYNRRSLKEIFPKEFYEAKRNKHYLAYALLDLDYFKSYNDTYGHQKGDDALQKVASLIKKRSKYAFRIGGDEFAMILISDKKTIIKHQIHQLQYDIRSLRIENKTSPVGKYLTCSIGVHIIKKSEYHFEEIYDLADTALYKAKALGRDQVIYM